MNSLNISNIVFAFLLSVLLTGLLIPQILLISYRCKLFDEHDPRKVHHGVVPRLGGFAFLPAILISILLVGGFNIWNHSAELATLMVQNELILYFSVCGIFVLYLVGLSDDLVGVRYRTKFVTQTIGAILLVSGGLWINDLHGFLGLHELPWWIGIPFTLLVVVFVINAINLIDGIDGLASGLCSIAMTVYGVTFFYRRDYFFAMIAFATLGVLIPFFCFNVFGSVYKHKKIFMGDTGTLTIGYLISLLGLRLLYNDGTVHADSFNPLMIVAAPLLIPCMDVVRVYLGRVKRGKNPFLPDKTHIHHKLLKAGLCQWQAMFSIVCVSLILSAALIYLSAWVDASVLIGLGILFFIVVNIYLSKYIKRKTTSKL